MVRCVVEGSTKTGDRAALCDAFCCDDGCTRHYAPTLGYIDIHMGSPIVGKGDLEPTRCKEHELALYVESYDSKTRQQTVRCPAPGCDVRQIEAV